MIAEVPTVLLQHIQPQLGDLCARLGRDRRPEAGDPRFIGRLSQVLACSPFVGAYLSRDPARLTALLEGGALQRSYSAEDFQHLLAPTIPAARDAAALGSALRQVRARELVRIAWRDITCEATLEETMLDLSNFADAALDLSLGWLHRSQTETFGVPTGAAGEPQSLSVIAMGKLGAQELNFSSDIDLLFAYPSDGETQGVARALSHQEYFNRLGQGLIKALGEVTEDGLVFRVDMRLRPFGDSSPLAMSFDALEAYYTLHGRDWERYAMIKARPAGGDVGAGDRLLLRLKPFVYRRYLDFSAIESLREMKRLIDREVCRKGMSGDIKLGPGGIREVEFIGQSYQLIRGGRRPLLQERQILEVLSQLKALAYLPPEVVAELCAAYRFLRATEHRLQQVDDQQTQRLPESDVDRARIALGMGFESWERFLAVLDQHRQRVQHHFNQLLIKPKRPTAPGAVIARPPAPGPWPGVSEPDDARRWLERAGFSDAKLALRVTQDFYRSRRTRRLSPTERGRLERVLPALLCAAAEVPEASVVAERVFRVIEAIVQRSVYLLLLEEHPGALQQLIRLCAASPWITARIAQQPILLDELLDPRALYAPPAPQELEAELGAHLAQLAPGDLEQEMEVLRHFKHVQLLRVAAADVAGALPVGQVSDRLSAIADIILRAALRLACEDLEARYGRPLCCDEGGVRKAGFAIVGYGKLGGFELGYGSDLDLVFLHDSRGEGQETEGAPHLSNQEYFGRLGQRVIHFLATATAGGRAYAVDTRLRPSGASGLLVSSLDAYQEYQEHHAWTWEHQALVRARAVAGDPRVMQGFARIRSGILGRARNERTLREEVRAMRAKMRRELSQDRADCFDIKHGRGGMTDIEFMVQYAVLRWAVQHPQLLDHTSNRRLLEALGDSGRLPKEDCVALAEAYVDYRARVHALALQERPAVVKSENLDDHRERVSEGWRRLIGE